MKTGFLLISYMHEKPTSLLPWWFFFQIYKSEIRFPSVDGERVVPGVATTDSIDRYRYIVATNTNLAGNYKQFENRYLLFHTTERLRLTIQSKLHCLSMKHAQGFIALCFVVVIVYYEIKRLICRVYPSVIIIDYNIICMLNDVNMNVW